jgi:hypothetical protein
VSRHAAGASGAQTPTDPVAAPSAGLEGTGPELAGTEAPRTRPTGARASGTGLSTRTGEVSGDGGSAAATGRRRLRRALPAVLLALLITAVAVLGVLTRADTDTTPLSPGNAAPSGARALTQVLGDRGVDVIHARSFAEVEEALADRDETGLFLSDPNGWLNADQLKALRDPFSRIVLAAPSEAQLRVLAPEIEPAGAVDSTAETLPAGCTVSDAESAGDISTGGLAYTGPVECFSSATADGGTGASYAAGAGLEVIVLGNPEILSNGTISRAGNAELALATLASEESLIWYQPTPADLAGATGTPSNPLELLPSWQNTLMLWLLGCALLAMLWRGRRMGPLAVEPLPVVVSAAETAEGRARLYQDARAVQHAAANLRAAALSRAAVRLRLPPSSPPAAVAQAVARRTGRRPEELRGLLDGPRPTTDKELAQWAQRLLDLEKEIDTQ